MGYICTHCFFQCHVTLQPCGACLSQQHAHGSPSKAQFDCPLCLPLQAEACPSSQTASYTLLPFQPVAFEAIWE